MYLSIQIIEETKKDPPKSYSMIDITQIWLWRRETLRETTYQKRKKTEENPQNQIFVSSQWWSTFYKSANLLGVDLYTHIKLKYSFSKSDSEEDKKKKTLQKNE